MLKRPIFPLEEDWDITKMVFYHGTSDKFELKELRPPDETGVLRDIGRSEFLDKVFFTNDIEIAKRYAMKAAASFGGQPIVYVVDPDYEYVWNIKDAEFVSSRASIVREAWRG